MELKFLKMMLDFLEFERGRMMKVFVDHIRAKSERKERKVLESFSITHQTHRVHRSNPYSPMAILILPGR
jgi:hypothetical protein